VNSKGIEELQFNSNSNSGIGIGMELNEKELELELHSGFQNELELALNERNCKSSILFAIPFNSLCTFFN
jgi:hypothetical protein